MAAALENDPDYGPELLNSSTSGHPSDKHHDKKARHGPTELTSADPAVEDGHDASNKPSSDQAPQEAPPARVPLPLGRPQPANLHHGWDASSVAMAKCDMCSRASRGVVHKCSQCKLSICKECCETGKLEGDSRHHLDPESVSWDAPPRPLSSRRPADERKRKRAARMRNNRRLTLDPVPPPTLSAVRAHDPFQLATKPAQGASVPSGYAVNERVASLNYTIAREDQGTGVQFPTATSQSRQQTNTYGGNAAAATLAAMSAQDSHQAAGSHTNPWVRRTASQPYPSTSHETDNHHPPSRQERHWSSPERVTNDQQPQRYRVQERSASREAPVPNSQHPSRAGNNHVTHGSQTERQLHLPPISTLVAEPRTHMPRPDVSHHNQRPPQEPPAFEPPSPPHWALNVHNNSPSPSPPPADHVQQPPSPDHEALALPLYVETLSRNLVQETYQTYHRNNPAPSLDLSLRYELCYLWRQRLIPQHGIDQGFRIALEIGYRAATQLGLDPLRNAAREWLRQTERQLYGAGN